MKVAFVVQRYGLEVNGGAEVHCRALAERMLAAGHEVTVLTTCARDHATWANAYPAGSETLNGVRVLRFPVTFPRNQAAMAVLGRLRFTRSAAMERAWLVAQGPYAPGLQLRLHGLDADAFVLFTYLYHPTVAALDAVGPRAVMVPTAHDEPAIHMGIMRRAFQQPGAIAFNTEEERDLVASVAPIGAVPNDVVGCGIDDDDGAPATLPAALAPAAGGDERFILYLGRIESGKGVAELCQAYLQAGALGARLVLAGRGDSGVVPRAEGIVELGFVSDAEKRWLLAHAALVVVPSRLESLSLLLLEAWSHRRAAIVNAACAVTSGHVRRSGGGAAYRDVAELALVLRRLLADDDARRRMGEAGRAYVDARYRWPAVEARLTALLERVRR